jgi:hypothetical protein
MELALTTIVTSAFLLSILFIFQTLYMFIYDNDLSAVITISSYSLFNCVLNLIISIFLLSNASDFYPTIGMD